MKNIPVIIILYSLLSLTSCIKESSNITDTILENKSGHRVEVHPYSNDSVVTEHVKIIESGEVQNVLSQSGWCKGKGFLYAISLQPCDSVIVMFDDAVKAVHYTFNKIGNNPKAVLFDDERNLLNNSNYLYDVLNETKRSIHNKYTYTFTAQDYLDAQ